MASAMEVGGVPVRVLGMGHPRPQDSGAGRDINGLGLKESTGRLEIKYLSSNLIEKREKNPKARKSTKKNKENKVDRKIS